MKNMIALAKELKKLIMEIKTNKKELQTVTIRNLRKVILVLELMEEKK